MKRLLLFAAIAALGASCSDKENCETPQQSGAIHISPMIADIAPASESRTSIAGATGTASWADGDAIGIYCSQISAANVQFTAAGSGSSATWSTTTPIYWKDALTLHKFLAYYPYAASGNTDPALVKLPALNSQTGTINTAHDFLISSNQNTTGVLSSGGAVALTFTHAFSLIQLNVQIGSGLAAGTTLTNFTIAGGASDKIYSSDATSTIALATGLITAGATTNTATIAPTTPPVLTSTPTPLYAVILPGTYLGPVNLTITFKDGNVTSYTTTAVSLATLAFLPATKYTFTVTLNRGSIAISNPTISDWTTISGGSLNPSF